MSIGVAANEPYILVNGGTTASYSPTVFDAMINYIAIPGTDVAVNLPSCATFGRGKTITIFNGDGTCSNANRINLTPFAGDTISGVGGITALISAYTLIILFSDGGTAWTYQL
jgi:hypothetical protein